jgi:hypothetical protein
MDLDCCFSSPRLAVIVPAFKTEFLCEAIQPFIQYARSGLLSLYIFDDASPHDIASVVQRWLGFNGFFFHRFDENLGGRDLAQHWNRCVNATHEPWVWLFSDDDRVSNATIEKVLSAVHSESSDILLALELVLINSKGQRIGGVYKLPARESALSFAIERLNGRRKVCAADHIFSRSSYEKIGYFESFPKAWYSDEIAWHKMACKGQGIHRINDALVEFRISSVSISGSHSHDSDKQIAQRQAAQYWALYAEYEPRLDKNALVRWRRLGLLASGINPWSITSWRHLRSMKVTRFQAIADILAALIIKAHLMLINLIRRLSAKNE